MGAERRISPDVPLAFNRARALAWSGLADKVFSTLERSGAIAGKPIGPRGEKLYYRPQLEAVVASLFSAPDNDDEFADLGQN